MGSSCPRWFGGSDEGSASTGRRSGDAAGRRHTLFTMHALDDAGAASMVTTPRGPSRAMGTRRAAGARRRRLEKHDDRWPVEEDGDGVGGAGDGATHHAGREDPCEHRGEDHDASLPVEGDGHEAGGGAGVHAVHDARAGRRSRRLEDHDATWPIEGDGHEAGGGGDGATPAPDHGERSRLDGRERLRRGGGGHVVTIQAPQSMTTTPRCSSRTMPTKRPAGTSCRCRLRSCWPRGNVARRGRWGRGGRRGGGAQGRRGPRLDDHDAALPFEDEGDEADCEHVAALQAPWPMTMRLRCPSRTTVTKRPAGTSWRCRLRSR